MLEMYYKINLKKINLNSEYNIVNKNYEFFLTNIGENNSLYYALIPYIILMIIRQNKEKFQKITLNLKESINLIKYQKSCGIINTLFKCMSLDKMKNHISFKLDLLERDENEKVDDIIEEDIKIKNNKINNNKEGEKTNIKEMFYITLQSVLIYLSDENLGIAFFDENTFFNFLREFQNICQIIEQLFIDFNVVSIEFYNLIIISQLIKDISNYPGINYTKENLSQFLFNIVISLKEEKKYLINEGNIENEKDAINKKLIDNFRDLIFQIDIMYKSLKNNGYEIINKIKMFIYRKQINKIKNNDYIQEIISTVFNNELLIIQSEIFLELLLPKKDLIPLLPSKKNKISKKVCLDKFMDYLINIEKINQRTRINLYLLNNKKSSILEEAILFYFDKIFKNFSICLEKQNEIEFNNNIYDEIIFEYFKICVNNVEEIINNKTSSVSELANLAKLYSISYIKNYSNLYVNHIIKDNNSWKVYSFKSFHKYLKNSFKKINIIETIEIYLFKLIYNKFDKDFGKFSNFMKENYKKRDLDYFKNFNFDSKISKINYLILDIDITNQNILTSFLKEKNNKFFKISEIPKLIIEASEPKILDLLYSIISNNLLSEYLDIDKNNLKKSLEIYNNFYKISKEILEKNILNINTIQSNILEFILNPNKFYKNVIQKQGNNLNINRFEILLYSFRFVLSIQNQENNFFSNFFKDNLNIFINNNYIPGVCMKNDIFLEYYPLVVDHLMNNEKNYGCYVCSCGYYYGVEPCGWPYQKSKCIKCGEEIGGLDHIMVKREGHMRIYKDEKDLEYYNDDGGKNTRFAHDSVMTLKQYKEEIIDKRPSIYNKGIFQEPLNSFLCEKKTVREMNILTYKVLHFVLFSHLFCANWYELINDDKLKTEYCVENMSCIKILEADWNFIKDYLKENGGYIIQIYLHYIFEPLIKILQKSSPEFKTPEIRNNFEKEVNNLLIRLTNTNLYKKYESKYLEANDRTSIDLNSTKSIILEFSDPEYYSKNNVYPCLKYYYFNKIPEKKDIFEKLKKIKDYNNKYPLLDKV